MLLEFNFYNEYVEQYLEFIDSRDFLSKDVIGENHHIFPKSIFGNNNITIRLTYQDHFRAHWFLAKLYETQGMKREYMQMAKAFFSFVHVKEYRKEIIKNYTEAEIVELADLIAEAKEANRISSIGELNSFYGKTHSPETCTKISVANTGNTWSTETKLAYIEYCKNRDPDIIPRHYYHDPVTLVNTRYSTNKVNGKEIPSNLIPGKYTSEKESLYRSLAMREFYSTYVGRHYWGSGENSAVFDTRHIFNIVTGERKRQHKDLPLPDGFIFSIGMTESHKQALRDAAYKRRGISQPHVIMINKNPEKIRKTAEKHRGMKRSQETCDLISIAAKNRIANGQIPSLLGKVKLFNLLTREIEYITPDVKLELMNSGNYTDDQLCTIINDIGTKKWHPKSEIVPIGFKVFKRKSPIK